MCKQFWFPVNYTLFNPNHIFLEENICYFHTYFCDRLVPWRREALQMGRGRSGSAAVLQMTELILSCSRVLQLGKCLTVTDLFDQSWFSACHLVVHQHLNIFLSSLLTDYKMVRWVTLHNHRPEALQASQPHSFSIVYERKNEHCWGLHLIHWLASSLQSNRLDTIVLSTI